MSEIENDIFEVWKELNPNEAYLQGLDEFAGKLFIPTPENTRHILDKIHVLKSKTQDQVEIKFLTSLAGTLKYHEPPHDISDIVWTLFGHMIKAGVNPKHISSLLDYSELKLENSKNIHNLDELPMELRIILQNKCNGLLGILKMISNEAQNEDLKDKIEKLSMNVRDYLNRIQVKGIEKGDFSEVFPILKNTSGGYLARKNIYPELIKELYDYYETPQEIEEKALSWLENDLPNLKDTAEKLAAVYQIDPNIENVDSEIKKRSSVQKTELLDFIRNFRNKTRVVIEKHLVRINPKYETKIIETPPYLLNFIPTAAMTMFDTLTDDPFNVFFVTTDEKRSPPTSVSDIFQLVVHEEYGHCVNFSNSAVSFEWKPNLVEKLNSHLHYPISEGISFHREYETLELLEKLAGQPRENLSPEERDLLDTLAHNQNIDSVLLESRFVVYKWRIIRFLRAIGDVRTNMKKQSLFEYVEWASEKTGFGKQTIYDQLFIFQENPGYAPCYSIAGMSLKGIQEEAKEKGTDILKFNTVASSLGFPPRTVFEERLRNL
jgi:hypothetical protein